MKSKFFIIICLLLSGIVSPSQLSASDFGSSSVSARESEVNTSLFSGELSYTIPIYELKDMDFDLEISLRYRTTGFKPFQPSGSCGQDWSLSAGGYITRLVQGQADEDIQVNSYIQNWGMLYSIQNGVTYNKQSVFEMDSIIINSNGLKYSDYSSIDDYHLDYLSDIYYFNFAGYKGRFLINNVGKPVILSGDFVKIDLSHIQDTLHSAYIDVPWDKSSIQIKTMDGYTYIFGGSSESLVITQDTTEHAISYSTILAWHITKIIAPSGRSLIFNYDSQVSLLQSYVVDYDWSEQSTNDSTHITHYIQKDCQLNSITTSDSIPLTISFFSSPEPYKKYAHNYYSQCKHHLQLDSVVVSYGNNILKKAQLSYTHQSSNKQYGATNNFYWRYLSQVHVSGIGSYIMDYNFNELYMQGTAIPFPIEHYPNLYPKTDEEYKNLVDRWGYWRATPFLGLLKEIQLPMGGKIAFSYGNHQYAQERKFRVIPPYDLEMYTQSTGNQTIGGARIEQINTYTENDSIVERKTFTYTKKGENSSSGILYNTYEIFYPETPNAGRPILHPKNYNMIDNHIGYSYVQQTIETGSQKYKTAYTYDIGNDSYTTQNNALINRNLTNSIESRLELCSGSLTYDGNIHLNGSLLAVDQYQNNTLTKSMRFQYNGISNPMDDVTIAPENSLGVVDTIVCLSNHSSLVARKLLICPNVLETKTIYEYGAEDEALITAIAYTYDTKHRIKKTIFTDSRGVRNFTRYTYPDDLENRIIVQGDNPAYPPLCLLNIYYRIDTPIEIVSGYIDHGVEYITFGTINLYKTGWEKKEISNFPLAHSPRKTDDFSSHNSTFVTIGYDFLPMIGNATFLMYPYLYRTMTLALSQPITNYEPAHIVGDSLVYDPAYQISCEFGYNIKGRPLYIKPYGKEGTVYRWKKNNDSYPTAITVGTQTTTYTHIPYVGISSMTDPLGNTTYYSYDSEGRLVEIYQIVNGVKQILNAYQYHTKTE